MNGEGENGSKEDMNNMNHSTLSSLLRSTYDPQHSTDPDNMYVHMYVCMYVCKCVCLYIWARGLWRVLIFLGA